MAKKIRGSKSGNDSGSSAPIADASATDSRADAPENPGADTKKAAIPGRTPTGRFMKGAPRPPNSGRKKGTANHTTRSIKEALAAAFATMQKDKTLSLLAWGRANPGAFYQLASKLIPSEIAQAAVQINVDARAGAAALGYNPEDPAEQWRKKKLVDWDDTDRMEAGRTLAFTTVLFGRKLTRDYGFPAEPIDTIVRALGQAILDAVNGRPVEPVPLLPAPLEGTVLPPEDEPAPPASPLDNFPSELRFDRADDVRRPILSERRVTAARSQRDRDEIATTGRVWTPEERAQADEADARDHRAADRMVEDSRRPRVIGAGRSLTAARHKRGW